MMHVQLDTDALLWWIFDGPQLPERPREAIRTPDDAICVGSASAREIATKHRIGKLHEGGDVIGQLPRLMRVARFTAMAISVKYARSAGQRAIGLRVPFDRMLAAQGYLGDLPLVTRDEVFRDLGVQIKWD